MHGVGLRLRTVCCDREVTVMLTWHQRTIVAALRRAHHHAYCIARAFRWSGGARICVADVITSDDPHPLECMSAERAEMWLWRRGSCTCALGRTLDD